MSCLKRASYTQTSRLLPHYTYIHIHRYYIIHIQRWTNRQWRYIACYRGMVEIRFGMHPFLATTRWMIRQTSIKMPVRAIRWSVQIRGRGLMPRKNEMQIPSGVESSLRLLSQLRPESRQISCIFANHLGDMIFYIFFAIFFFSLYCDSKIFRW